MCMRSRTRICACMHHIVFARMYVRTRLMYIDIDITYACIRDPRDRDQHQLSLANSHQCSNLASAAGPGGMVNSNVSVHRNLGVSSAIVRERPRHECIINPSAYHKRMQTCEKGDMQEICRNHTFACCRGNWGN
jgi:hypothetical protein